MKLFGEVLLFQPSYLKERRTAISLFCNTFCCLNFTFRQKSRAKLKAPVKGGYNQHCPVLREVTPGDGELLLDGLQPDDLSTQVVRDRNEYKTVVL